MALWVSFILMAVQWAGWFPYVPGGVQAKNSGPFSVGGFDVPGGGVILRKLVYVFVRYFALICCSNELYCDGIVILQTSLQVSFVL